MKTKLVCVLSVAALLGDLTLNAQLRIVGAISGTVQDPTGAVVPGAKVILKDEATGILKETATTANGTFLVPDLSHGSYEVTVTAAGFQTAVVKGVRVSTSQTTDVKVNLTVGQTAESVTVEGVAPLLEVTSQLVTTTTGATSINRLPVGGRNGALQLARLQPGISPPTPSGNLGRYNNLPGGALNVTVDGINDASNGFKSGGTVFYMTVPVRLGAVEELSVETGGLGADSGAQSGANIKFVTRRGGNRYHGSVFYEASSEQFNANSWTRNAQGLGRVFARRHDFGGNIGGPVVPIGGLKDKFFMFLNFERSWAPITNARTLSVLTPSAQAGNFTYLLNGTTDQLRTVSVMQIAANAGARTTLDPVVQSILSINNQIPRYSTQIPDTDFNADSYTWNAGNNDYAYYPTARFDYHMTSAHQLTWSWNYRHNWQAGERRLPVPEINRTNPFRLGYFVWAAALQSTLTPRTFNEFRYGVQHSGDTNRRAEYGLHYEFQGKPLRIGGTLPFGPTVPFIDQNNTTGRHFITTIYDTMTLTRGEHTITIGGSFRKTDWKDTSEIFQIPTYATGTPSGDPLPGTLFTATTVPGIVNTALPNTPAGLYNLLTGRVSQANFTKVVDPDTLQYNGFINWTWTRSDMGGLYIQDRWRIRKSFTLNYGLRWEVQGDMHDVKNLTAGPDIQSLFGPSVTFFAPGVLSGNNNPGVQVGRQAYKPDYKNLAPNLGFAWNPNYAEGWMGKLFGGSKSVVRGSYGIIYYDEGTQMFAQNLGPNAGKQISANLIPGQSSLPAFYTLADIVANPLTVSNFTFATTAYATSINQADQTFQRTINGMNPNLRAPYTTNWTLGVQRELMKNTVLEVRYVGNQGHRAWRTINLNEVNIFENGFLDEFKNAQANLTSNQQNGRGNTFVFNGLPGQNRLPIFDAAFGPRGSVTAIAAGSGYGSSAFIGNLQNGEAGTLANTLATNENYVCRMFGNSFSPCPRRNAAYNAPGAYPINFFLLNPYVAGRMNYVDDSGWNSYNGLQVQLRKRHAHGLDWTTNYTWSKSLSTLWRETANQNLDYTTLRNTAGLDRNVGQFDLRHVFQTFGTYELPLGRGKRFGISNGILDGIAGGWTLGSIVVFNTGAPVQLTGGGFQTVNNTNNPFANGVRLAPGVTVDQIQEMFNAPRSRLTGRAGVTDLQRLAVDPRLVGPDGRANPQYVIPNRTPGEFGQLLFLRARNTFSWNASMTKRFRITEGVAFDLFASANNVLNHPSWGLGSSSVFSTSFGVVGAPGGNRSMVFRGTLGF
ncbi:MAG: carboxypeptidase regulatory-like domain-containing protein [Bryobacteraceae bacterium]